MEGEGVEIYVKKKKNMYSFTPSSLWMLAGCVVLNAGNMTRLLDNWIIRSLYDGLREIDDSILPFKIGETKSTFLEVLVPAEPTSLSFFFFTLHFPKSHEE